MRGVLLVVAVVGAVAGVARADAPKATTASKVALVSAGEGPRQRVRFAPAKGTKQTITTVETNASARGAIGNVPRPAPIDGYKVVADLEVSDVLANGDFSYRFKYRSLDLVPAPDDPPAKVTNIRAALGVMAGFGGTATASSRGVMTAFAVDTPKGSSPSLVDLANQLGGAVARGAMQWPEEPIGVGAKWEAKLSATAGGVTVEQTTTFELTALRGKVATVAVSLASTGVGKTDHITTHTTAAGTVTVDLARPVPTDGHLTTRTEVVLDSGTTHLAQVTTADVVSSDH